MGWAREKLRQTKEKLTAKRDAFSGKTVEEQVDAYTSIYGEVLMGLHRELEAQKRLNARLRADLQQAVEDLHNSGASSLKWRIWLAQISALLALVLGASRWILG